MSGIASVTGLIPALIRPIYRPKPKTVELSGSTKPAPFILRPFAGLFNPYPYGCSVLCNHPADNEAKEIFRRAKDIWASDGKALLLPDELEMIRTSLLAVNGITSDTVANIASGDIHNVEATPEELFRKYTETDSRPLTPAPTLASGPALTNRAVQDDLIITCSPQERTTLVLDLRTISRDQMNKTLSWHALTLEPQPVTRKNEIFVAKTIPRQQHSSTIRKTPTSLPSPPSAIVEDCETKNLTDAESDQSVIIRRRGKRLRKRKYRRASTYGQQTEVRDFLEPAITQVSQIGDTSRRPSIHTNTDKVDDSTPRKKTSVQTTSRTNVLSSFLTPDILQHLCRELNHDKIEAEFSIKRRIALEEALRIKGGIYSSSRGIRQISANALTQNTPRLFSRQTARFELLDSQSLRGLKPLQYLNRYVHIISERKSIFHRIFNRFNEGTLHSMRYISPNDIEEALCEVIGKALTDEQRIYLTAVIGEITELLSFRQWCGLCAVVERLLCPLPSKEKDPPLWLERVDFEVLEQRLKTVEVDPTLTLLLKEIRDR